MKSKNYRKEGHHPKERRASTKLALEAVESSMGGGAPIVNNDDGAKYRTEYNRRRVEITLLDGSNRKAIYDSITGKWDNGVTFISDGMRRNVERFYT